ncbi:MerR family transcriptional regulator [Vallitalea okinawensis]|uniref:MerR family transcriptional regulator n=1 Tax=Vallitalea okinawensis TaxID=2078660 RepID=UPI000CFCB83A|nr:MerR family transcriptional regulator [Vallitalea okinawensis]
MFQIEDYDELYTIGQISKMCDIPIQTLRYYDEIGLLLPERVDTQNNYRYYSKKQVLDLNIIKHYKASGFSLEDIRHLAKGENMETLHKKLEDKLLETKKNIRELDYLREKLEMDINNLALSSQLGEKGDLKKDNKDGIEIKTIPTMPVLFTRYHCANNPSSFIKRFSELGALMDKYKLYRVGPLMAIFYDHYSEYDFSKADIEVCMPIAGSLSECPNIREYGGFLGATMLHKGQYSKLPASYGKVLDWIDQQGYEYVVPTTEKYIIDATSTSIEENYVTEVILSLRKK